MDEKEIQKRIKSGEILAQVTFEVVGNPKEHVETTIRSFINNIKNDSRITVLSEELGEAEEVQGSQGLWSTYADTEMLIGSLDKLVWLCVNFMPASIEIIAPEELTLKENDLTNWLNDLLAKLHEISVNIRQTNIKDELVLKNMNALIQNSVLVVCENYHDPCDISQKVGIDAEQLKPFFEALLKKGKLEKKGEEYYTKGYSKDYSEKSKKEPKKEKKKHGAKKRS